MAPGIHFQTRRGTLVSLSTYPEEPPAKRAAYDRYLTRFTGIEKRREATASYNCYGMALSTRRGWIDLNDVQTVLTDDGYRKIVGSEVPSRGDLVLYKDSLTIEHIGLIVDIHPLGGSFIPLVLSKWGPGPEFIHSVARTPFGVDFEYWTDRP
jgi:hypothetical protein